jgi:cell division protease FtsH
MRTSQPGRPGQAAPAPWRRWLLPLGGTAGVLALLALARGAPPGMALSYSQFVADVSAGAVRAVTIGPAGQVTGSLATGQPFTTTIPVALDDRTLAGRLAVHHAQVTATAATGSSLSALIGLLSLLLAGGLLYSAVRGYRRQGAALGGLGGAGGLARAKARVIDAERPATVNDAHGRQVAYNGHLLYTFTGDRPGQVTGQGFQNFFVATPGLAPAASSRAGTVPAPGGLGY